MSNASIGLEQMSEGMRTLTEGYVDYAEEVIIRRALPDLRDGLKPVNRRILYTVKESVKGSNKVKSQTVVGSTLKYHPHGDSSVYQALVLMTDSNGSLSVPVLSGQGNFGGVHTTDPAAASRYTMVGLHPNSQEYFGEMGGINLVPNYDSTGVEPDVLPVSYPSVLCNSTSGIAVGFRSNIPSFNFNDVIDLTVEYLDNGECKTVICPDFVTGGYYIRNNKELDKLMRTGSAKIKLRGRVEKTGKEIKVIEFPFGRTIQSILDQVQKANIMGIREAGNVDDFEHGVGLLIDCTSKNKVDDVLLALYRDTDLQCTFSADMMTVLNGKPVRKGVFGIIEEWVKWRRQVLIKEYTNRVEGWKSALREPIAFLEVIKDSSKRDALIDIVLKKGEDEGIDYILNNYSEDIVDRELAKWVVRRRLPDFKNGGSYLKKYNELMELIKQYEGYLSNIDSVIKTQLLELKSRIGSQYPRKTEITNSDYEFISASSGEVVKDNNQCTFVLKDGFLRKMHYLAGVTEANGMVVDALASDVLLAIDNRGRVLRVYCEDLPYSTMSDVGTYLPKYFGLSETDDYKIKYIGKLDGSTKMIVYADGNVGFIGTSEWTGVNRRVKVIEKGVNQASAHCIGAVIDVPECLVVVDSKGRFSYQYTNKIKRKDRTAKTRVFNVKSGSSIIGCYGCTSEESAFVFSNMTLYSAPNMHTLESQSSLSVDLDDFIEF